eukprot:12400078-Karenia_brevis.AAC.1
MKMKKTGSGFGSGFEFGSRPKSESGFGSGSGSDPARCEYHKRKEKLARVIGSLRIPIQDAGKCSPVYLACCEYFVKM